MFGNYFIRGTQINCNFLPIHERFEKQVTETPQSIAVEFNNEVMTYRELNMCANQIAHEILSYTKGRSLIIGILLDRCTHLLPTNIAVLKANCICLPLPTELPKEKVNHIVKNSRTKYVITNNRNMRNFNYDVQVINLDQLKKGLSTRSRQNPCCSCSVDQPAYVIYTSGTSGNPKGVVISHKSIDNNLQWRKDFYQITLQDVFFHKSSIGFDVAIWEMLLPLMIGAKVVICEPRGHFNLPYLRDSIIKYGVTIIQFVGTVFRLFLELDRVDQCTSLRIISCGGEAWPFELVEKCKSKFDRVTLINAYGPTETTLATSAWKCDANYEHKCIPIGQPAYNAYFVILNEEQKPVRKDENGELYIGGVGLAKEYLYNKKLTIEKFVELSVHDEPPLRLYRTGDIVKQLPDDNILFIGRRDTQVKIDGIRYELEEIEEVLRRVDGVKSAIVVCREEKKEKKILYAFLVKSGSVFDENKLYRYCRDYLPTAMIPKYIRYLDQIPLAPNGKVDRNALLMQIKREKRVISRQQP